MIKRIVDDFKNKRNIDLYIAVFLALVVAILNTFDLAGPKSITSATLALLSLISLSLLINRQHYHKIEGVLSTIEIGNYFADLFLKRKYDRSVVQDKLYNAKDRALFLGISFLRTLLFLQDSIESKLQAGIKFRFIIQKPGSQSVRMAAFRSHHSSEKEINDQIDMVLSRFAKLSTRYSSELLDVRVIDYVPPYSIIVFDPYESAGHMFVRLTSFRSANERRPFFELSNRYSTASFEFFRNEFETIWEQAEKVNLRDFVSIHNEKE